MISQRADKAYAAQREGSSLFIVVTMDMPAKRRFGRKKGHIEQIPCDGGKNRFYHYRLSGFSPRVQKGLYRELADYTGRVVYEESLKGQLPKELASLAVDSRPFTQKSIENTFLYCLRSLAKPVQHRAAAVVDLGGRHTEFCERLICQCGVLKIITASPGGYAFFKEDMLARYGAPVMVSSQSDGLYSCDLVFTYDRLQLDAKTTPPIFCCESAMPEGLGALTVTGAFDETIERYNAVIPPGVSKTAFLAAADRFFLPKNSAYFYGKQVYYMGRPVQTDNCIRGFGQPTQSQACGTAQG